MKLLLLATIKLFLLSILNVYYLYLKIAMVVESIFLNLWIFPIRHLPTIIITLTLHLGGGWGGLTWLMAPGAWPWSPPKHHHCHQKEKISITWPELTNTAPLQLLRPSSASAKDLIKTEFIINTTTARTLLWNRCFRARSLIKALFRQIMIAVALIFTCLRGAIWFNQSVWPFSCRHVMTLMLIPTQGRVCPA